MADNTVLDPGVGGDTVATDDIGGTKHQRVKVQHGADGSATDVSAASPLPVDDADTQTKLDTLIAAQDGVEALLTSIKTAVEIIDNSIAGSETQVDVVSAPAIALDAGTLAALETIGLDATTLAALETIELGATTLAALESITIGTALPAGTAAIGKLAANSGVDIGDVDVTTVPADPFGANADAAVAAGATGSIQAKLRRVTQGLEDLKTLIVLGAGSAVIGKVDHATTGTGSGRKIVTTAGTRVALAGSTAAKWVTITAETDNTGFVVVGSAAGVIAALATREGTPLAAGDSITLAVDNLADVGLDSTVSGDGTTFTYGT